MILDLDALAKLCEALPTTTAVETNNRTFWWCGPLRKTRDEAITDGNNIADARTALAALIARCSELEDENFGLRLNCTSGGGKETKP